MPDKISVRLPPALKHALEAHVRQDNTPVSDVIHKALEAYLGLRPTVRPALSTDLSDTVSDIQARLEVIAANMSDMQRRLERLEGVRSEDTPVRQRETDRPTQGPTQGPTSRLTDSPTRRKNALPFATLRAIAAARQQHPELTHRDFAAYLFTSDIYRSTGRNGVPVPPSTSLIHRWLKEALAAGLLP
jgi:Arc/MetJ-type ribon-helix-helix transcriptional regulator